MNYHSIDVQLAAHVESPCYTPIDRINLKRRRIRTDRFQFRLPRFAGKNGPEHVIADVFRLAQMLELQRFEPHPS
jgi:hypothetical protein